MNTIHQQQFETGARLDPVTTRALIASYQPVDVVSTEYQRRFLELIDQRPDQFANRYNYYAGIHGHFTARGDQPDHLHYDIRFLFTTDAQEFHANSESKDVVWVPVANLDAYLPHWLANTRLKTALKARFG